MTSTVNLLYVIDIIYYITSFQLFICFNVGDEYLVSEQNNGEGTFESTPRSPHGRTSDNTQCCMGVSVLLSVEQPV